VRLGGPVFVQFYQAELHESLLIELVRLGNVARHDHLNRIPPLEEPVARTFRGEFFACCHDWLCRFAFFDLHCPDG
jgi:hypothetical protein